jgi:hypothetical protein
MSCGKKSLVGRVYRSKRWAKRFAQGRPVKKTKGGWRIGRGHKKKRRHKSKKRTSFFGF